MAKEADKLWGGRFDSKPSELMEKFNASIGFDNRLWRQDLEASIHYAKCLEGAGLLTKLQGDGLVDGLKKIVDEWERNEFKWHLSDEDIHTAHERRLKEFVGTDLGGMLHTGRSRNDQVATDTKLWLIDNCLNLSRYFLNLLNVIIKKANDNIDIVMAGYTHLQRAQPIRFSHWLLSYGFTLLEDYRRLVNLVSLMKRHCPLGSGAIAGNPFQLDLVKLAKNLGFDSPPVNSMFCVSDRDFIVDFLSWSALVSTHLSKLSEDLIIYSSREFGFITIDDQYSTGSSLMPQKKNADSAELIRGKSGRCIGNLVTILTVIKGTPSTFNKDYQEDKEQLFDSFDTISNLVRITTGVIETMMINKDKCFGSLSTEMLATDLAYYLVRKGVAFRQAHHIAGRVIKTAEIKNVEPSKLELIDMQNISPQFTQDVYQIWNFETSIEQYKNNGGTCEESCKLQIQQLTKSALELTSDLTKLKRKSCLTSETN